MKRYKMKLPDTDIETFIKYTKRLIESKRFPQLSRGALYSSAAASLPCPVYPYLHWDDENDYVYYGHRPDYCDRDWLNFTLDKALLGEL